MRLCNKLIRKDITIQRVKNMVEKYKNKYRVKSHRLEGWDYSDNGYYFVTLVTQNRQCNLGEIVKDGMVLSKMGKIIDDEWNHYCPKQITEKPNGGKNLMKSCKQLGSHSVIPAKAGI